MKLKGYLDEVTRHEVVGWALDEDQPERHLELVVSVNQQRVATGTTDVFREGLREQFGPRATGDYGFRISFDPSLSAFQDYEIEVTEASTSERLNNGLQTLAAPAALPAPLRPILVTSTGRSGTTLLMSDFVRHPRVVVANRYSYEIKLLSYYSAAFNVLTSHLDRVNSTNPDSMFDRAGQFKIGHNPFNAPGYYTIAKDPQRLAQLFEQTIPSRYAAVFAGFIRDYYEVIRESEGKLDAMHFAEKVDLDDAARFGPRVFFGEVREIVLARDPRDLLCSAKSFWKLDSDEALSMIKTTVPRLLTIARSGREDITSIRYEDLVNAPQKTRQKLYAFLGIRDDESDGAIGDKSLFKVHGTSKDAGSSIGRWRQDLSDSEAAACNEAFADYMDYFGYTV